jgi:ABC-type multidrug transport system fused ATPase/permease subunit
VGYHDTNHTAEAVSRMSDDVGVMLKGIGEPFANTIQFGTQFVAGIIMGFVRGPKLAAVVCCFLPLLALCAAGMKVLLGKIQKLEADAYARAGEIATESISNIRSVASNCGEEAEVRRYDRHLSQAERMGRFKGLATGLSMGGIWFSILSCYGVGLWYGSTLIVDSRQADLGCEIDPLKAGCFTGGSVINVFFAIIIAACKYAASRRPAPCAQPSPAGHCWRRCVGLTVPNPRLPPFPRLSPLPAVAIAQAAPNLSAFGTACGAAATIYELIDRVPEIDNLAEGGLKPDPSSVRGRVEFRNVTFAYPSRPTATVLRGFNLVIEAGHTVALVGPSGCGKSSVIALLQRWYDPQAGSITLDGVDLREYNVQWLRERMGLVLQDPVLFQASVAENIALGLPEVASGAQAGADGSSAAVGADTLRALQPRIEAAARAANAHDFILRDLSDGYGTYVGERGGQMSGGQRQRVCIARALIRSPAIMLLDEATSALDTRSERIVQAAIDRLLSGEADAELARSVGAAAAAGLRATRTSVCIAHRLSTIRGATSIVVMEGGSITAQGTHEQLMAVEGGLYRTMVEQQALGSGSGHAGARKRRAGSAASGARASATGAGVGSGLAAAAAAGAASADDSGDESGDEEGEGEEAAPASSHAAAGDHTAIAVKGTGPEAIARAVSARSAASARSRTHTHASVGSPEGSGVAPEVDMLASVMAVPLPVRRPSTVGGPVAGEADGEAGEVAMVTSTNANPLFSYLTPSTHPADGTAAPAADGDAIQHRGSSAVRRGASSAQRKAAAAAAAEATAPAAAAAAGTGDKGKGKDGKDKKASEPDLPAVPFKRVFAYQRPELWHMVLATLSAGIAGAAMPSFSILFSRMTNVFYSSTADIERNTAAYCGYFILIGVVCFFGQLGMWGLFAYAGEKLTRRLRVATYKAVLTQEVAYFDDPANTTGRITARLSEEAALVKATTGEKLALATQSICSLITGLVIAFVASWRVALLVLAVFPLIALVGAAQVKLLAGMSAVKESEEAGNIVLEATSSIRTVYAFGLQNLLLARFAAALRPMEEKGFRRSWMTGAGMGAFPADKTGRQAGRAGAGRRYAGEERPQLQLRLPTRAIARYNGLLLRPLTLRSIGCSCLTSP